MDTDTAMQPAEAIRRFSRLITKTLGVLDEDFLGRDRQLGESRVLFEIGRGASSVADLRTRLDLDSGYLSRVLRRLEHDDLVKITPDPADGRRRSVTLTTAGRAEWDTLDQLSRERVESVIAPLGDTRAEELATHLRQAHRLFAVATATTERVGSTTPAAVAAMNAYFTELDHLFPDGFDPGDWQSSSGAAFDGTDGAFILLHCEGQIAGCGAWQTIAPGVGEIKRMWLDPAFRGVGLGRRLLEDLERARRRTRTPHRPPRHQRDAQRRDGDVRAGGLHPDRPVQRQSLRHALLRQGCRPRLRIGTLGRGPPRRGDEPIGV